MILLGVEQAHAGGGVSPLEADLLKILVDKALLGVIAAVFGYYLARLLENHRTRNAYNLFLLQQRFDACRTALKAVAEHHKHLEGLWDCIDLLVKKHPDKLTDEEAKPGFVYAEQSETFRTQMAALMTMLPADVVTALNEYLDEAGRLSAIVKGDFSRPAPTKDDLTLAFAKFSYACGTAMSSVAAV